MPYVGIEGNLSVGGNLMKSVIDLTVEVSRTEVAIKCKGSDHVRYLGGLKDYPVEIEGYVTNDCEGQKALEAAFHSGEEVEVTFTHAPQHVTNFIVTKFTHNEPVDDAMTFSASLRPSAKELSLGGGSVLPPPDDDDDDD